MNKKVTVLIILLLFTGTAIPAQLNVQLCNKNEAVVFAFQLQNKKWVSLCKEENENYLVYRFGTADKVELQYPSVLDNTSWQKFSFQGYERGGGKMNAAMSYAYLGFTNSDVDYEIAESWSSETDEEHCGISIITEKKTINLAGLLKSRKGYLLQLRNNEKIKQEEQ